MATKKATIRRSKVKRQIFHHHTRKRNMHDREVATREEAALMRRIEALEISDIDNLIKEVDNYTSFIISKSIMKVEDNVIVNTTQRDIKKGLHPHWDGLPSEWKNNKGDLPVIKAKIKSLSVKNLLPS